MTRSPDPDPDPDPDSDLDADADRIIEPDSVTPGGGSGEMRGSVDGGFGLDELAERAVAVLFGLLRRASQLARAVLLFVAVTCFLGMGLGVNALSGGARTLWILIGGFFTVVAVGAVLVALWRLGAVRRSGTELVGEVRTLISGDQRSERTVIDTIESTEGAGDDGIVYMSRQFFSLKDTVQGHTSNFAALSMALGSITSFPGLMALATVIGFAMLGLAGIFGLILLF